MDSLLFLLICYYFLLQLVRTFYVKSVSIGSQSINVSVSGGRGLIN